MVFPSKEFSAAQKVGESEPGQDPGMDWQMADESMENG
jgi:hypothetical protein